MAASKTSGWHIRSPSSSSCLPVVGQLEGINVAIKTVVGHMPHHGFVEFCWGHARCLFQMPVFNCCLRPTRCLSDEASQCNDHAQAPAAIHDKTYHCPHVLHTGRGLCCPLAHDTGKRYSLHLKITQTKFNCGELVSYSMHVSVCHRRLAMSSQRLDREWHMMGLGLLHPFSLAGR